MARNPPVDIQDVGGAPPSATNPLVVRLSDGTAYYVAGGGAGGALSTAAKGTTAAGNPTSTAVDANTQALDVYVRSPSGGGAGGPATIVDGGDVAQGALADVAWVSGSGSLIAISKAEFGKLEAIRALLAGTLTVGTHAVTGPLTDAQLRASAVPVSGFPASQAVTGAFYQATQPVSLATNTPDVTDRAARLLGHVTVDSAPSTAVTGPLTDAQLRALAVPVSLASAPSTPVTGTFWQATQPVSGAFFQATQPVSLAAAVPVTDNAGSLTVDAPVATPVFVRLSDGAAAIATLPVSLAVAPSTPVTGTFWQATQPVSAAALPLPAGAAADATLTGGAQVSQLRASTLCVTQTGLISAAVTATLPAAGAGLFHYISRINIVKYAGVATVGAAAPTVVTSTNLPGAVAWSAPTALAIGTQYETDVEPDGPIKSSVANTATTIVAPLTTSIIWRITVYYYTAP